MESDQAMGLAQIVDFTTCGSLPYASRALT